MRWACSATCGVVVERHMKECSVVDHDWSRLVDGVFWEDCEVYGRFCSTNPQGAKRKRERNEVGVSCYESSGTF
jgi:hypothetical protein